MVTGEGGLVRAGRTNRLAVAALVCGILGVAGLFPLAIAAIVCGRKARRPLLWTFERGHGVAKAGRILGDVGLGYAFLGFVLPLLIFVALPTSSPLAQCGQCRYSLTVVSKKGVSVTAAESALAACVHNPAVLKVDGLSTKSYSRSDAPVPGQQGGHLAATISMRAMSVSLGTCLSKQPGLLTISSAAFGPMYSAG